MFFKSKLKKLKKQAKDEFFRQLQEKYWLLSEQAHDNQSKLTMNRLFEENRQRIARDVAKLVLPKCVNDIIEIFSTNSFELWEIPTNKSYKTMDIIPMYIIAKDVLENYLYLHLIKLENDYIIKNNEELIRGYYYG